MRSRRTKALTALVATAALGLTACGGSSDNGGSSGSGGSGGSAENSFNAGVGKIWNPSDQKGGTLKMGQAGDWADSVDPGNTYYGYSWDFARLYGRSLTMFKPAPGKAGLQLVPDLAQDLGKVSDGGKTWTYTLRSGVKFEDGTPVTSEDVKYAVERSTDKAVLALGPTYFNDYLDWPAGYKGPYKTPDMNTDSAIETPDDQTIVFHLVKPFEEFDYFAMLPSTAPVPKDKDTGVKYKEHVVSTGPYMWKTFDAGKLYQLVRNPEWDQSTDPNRTALPDQIDVQLNMNPDDLDNQLIAGDTQVDVVGTGAQPAALSRMLGDPTLKAPGDNPLAARTWYTNKMTQTKPFDDIHCRRAIQYGMHRASYQAAYGGPIAGGELATTVLPPTIPGYTKFDLYPAGSDSTGDLTKAKDELKQCGQPDGFDATIAYRAERPKEKATAEAFQQALDRIGIKLSIKPLPEGTYSSDTCGVPDYVAEHKIGMCVYGWGADWPRGFGYLSQIVDSRTIGPGGTNYNVRLPEVDKLLDKAVATADVQDREAIWGQIDKLVMQDAVIYPGIYSKTVLIRPTATTNVFVNDGLGGYYDFVTMGVQQ